MEKLYVEVKETIDGVTRKTLEMKLTGTNYTDIDGLSALFDNVVMSDTDYDRLTDIWNQHRTLKGLLVDLEKTGLIEDYEIK